MSDPESRFTPTSDFCPHPEYWHSMDQHSTEDEVSQLVAAFVRALQPEFVLETGTAYGVSAWNIGLALLKNKHGRLDSIDSDYGMIEAATKNFEDWTVGKLPVNLICTNSMSYTPPQKIDFAFFDSWQEGRELEFRRFREYMDAGIIVAFHDTAPHHVVLPTIQKLQEEGLIRPIFLRTPRGICFAEVL